MDLHSNLFQSRANKKKGGRYAIASLIVHGLFIGSVVWAGATATQHVASEKPIRAFLTQGAAPPPPPPPPPPPAASHSAPKQVAQVQQPKITPPTFVQPRVIPQEMPKIDIPQAPVTTTAPVDPTPAAPSSGPADGGQPGGVVGGVAGGVTGGTVGGEVGGQIGGQLGGEKGGVVGGTLGGQVGGTGTGTAGNGTGGDDAPKAVPDGPLHVGGDVKAPIALNRVQPEYTETARKARIGGVVVLEAIINKDGTVEQVRVLKGLPMGLSEKAEEAVKGWRFKPGTLGGQPVDVIFSLTVNFKLDQ
jgi:protein TonB